MLPYTYTLDKSKRKCRICDTCSSTNEKFRAALLGGREAEAIENYNTGCVNLRSPYTIYGNELPVHCVVQGGSLPLLTWLIEEKFCPIFKDDGTSLVNGNKESVMGIAAKVGQTHVMRYLMLKQNCKVTEIKDTAVLWNALDKLLREGNASGLPFPVLDVPDNETGSMPASREMDHKKCITCHTSERQSIIVPCGHYVCCSDCGGQLSECPVCRTEVGQVVCVRYE
jgi:hypothetical protein